MPESPQNNQSDFIMIEKIKVGGRGTYFCPTCQKLASKEMG